MMRVWSGVHRRPLSGAKGASSHGVHGDGRSVRARYNAPTTAGQGGLVKDLGKGFGGDSSDEEPRPVSDLERAALLLLRRRGYSVVPPEEADLHAAIGAAGGRDILRLRAAAAAFRGLVDWVATMGPTVSTTSNAAVSESGWLAAGGTVAASTAGLLRSELRGALLPVLVHLFLTMAEAGEFNQGHKLLDDCTWQLLPSPSALAAVKPGGGVGVNGSSARKGCRIRGSDHAVIQRLRLARSIADLEGDQKVEQFQRQERTIVALSPLAREMLSARLLTPETVAVSDVFKMCVRIVDLGSAEASVAAIMGPCPEEFDAELKEINSTEFVCAIDVADPPVAYGEAWQPSEATAGDEQKHSATFISRQCSLPLPAPESRTRLRVSASFSALASAREPLDGDRLPVPGR
eukprot:TRINITY_DN26955_c0_g1_i2.p1 TRINITY_DN26955_c0_g1~~TRINITY_DN26955_c0_g1_i2.p1  ORF type:complete len:417 (+),score=68.08 TRINITY_DN26955_c0_g1_i2:39-1253(+)